MRYNATAERSAMLFNTTSPPWISCQCHFLTPSQCVETDGEGGRFPKHVSAVPPPPPRHSHFSLHIRTALFGARPPLHSCANQSTTAFLTLTRGTVFRGSNHYRTSNNSEKNNILVLYLTYGYLYTYFYGILVLYLTATLIPNSYSAIMCGP